MPVWMPHAVKLYLAHTEHGHSIRSLARYSGVHPSTVSRSVRKIETLRDDPLIDRAVQELSKYCLESAPRRLEDKPMSFHNPDPNPPVLPGLSGCAEHHRLAVFGTKKYRLGFGAGA